MSAPGCRLLGIVGAPASGKSTLTDTLVASLTTQGAPVSSVPMDGFHLSQRQLAALGRSERKGAPDTFDAHGYGALLQRIRSAHGTTEVVYAPGFDRAIEEPIAASLAVSPDAALVITEGNYLLLPDGPWSSVAAMLDETWFLDVETSIREAWLVERHQRFGRSEADAHAWMANTDRPNAQRINATASSANRHLLWDGDRIRFVD